MAGPDHLSQLVVEHSRLLGAVSAQVLVIDLQQVALRPLDSTQDPVPVEGTAPGRTFATGKPMWSSVDGLETYWCPLLDGVERLGVLGVSAAERSDHLETRTDLLAPVVASLVVTKSLYGDHIEQVRRTRELSVAAEMQWSVLPPRTFGTDLVLISGALEPAYDIGGDTFDYALNGDVLHVIILDGVGRGLRAATLAAIAVATYRRARRAGRSLEETVRELDDIVAQQSAVAEFVTGWIAELDCVTGTLRYVNAGHPLPYLLRDGHVVKVLECRPTIPLGIGHEILHVAEESLEPGDRILAFTDGVVEGRDAAGEFFGDERLVELLEHEAASGHDAPEILRRLTLAVLDYQRGSLADDSSMVLLEWRPSPR
jgi:serine phosphatase RsbU (regulator of sigma subunit)